MSAMPMLAPLRGTSTAAHEGHEAEVAGGTSPAACRPAYVIVRRAMCGSCERDVPNGFRCDTLTLRFPFVAEVEWVRSNPTRCRHCKAEGQMLFDTDPYEYPMREVAS